MPIDCNGDGTAVAWEWVCDKGGASCMATFVSATDASETAVTEGVTDGGDAVTSGWFSPPAGTYGTLRLTWRAAASGRWLGRGGAAVRYGWRRVGERAVGAAGTE